MTSRHSTTFAEIARCAGTLLTAVAAFHAAGCSGGGSIGLDVKKPAAERPDITPGTAAAGRLVMPGETAFNLTSFKSGQVGPARGASDPAGSNGAVCRAEARDGGSAWGEVQIGYCLDNAAGRPLLAVAKVKVRVKGSISAEPTAPPQSSRSTASNNLVFLIKDTYGLVLKQEQLFTQDLERGAGATTAAHDLVFEVRLEPDRGYYFLLAGRSDVQAAESQSVTSALEAADYALELSWHDAPAAGRTPATASAPSPTSSPASPRHSIDTP